jgi:OPA family glycerol-3-phosphate transporter-like MFS transporter 1/2
MFSEFFTGRKFFFDKILKNLEDKSEERVETPVMVHEEEHAIGFIGALRIPGVIEFSMCLFFAKLVSYTFLYWLPNYISSKSHVDAEESAVLSTVFDWGEFSVLV